MPEFTDSFSRDNNFLQGYGFNNGVEGKVRAKSYRLLYVKVLRGCILQPKANDIF